MTVKSVEKLIAGDRFVIGRGRTRTVQSVETDPRMVRVHYYPKALAEGITMSQSYARGFQVVVCE